jgi:hypothetical protein
MMNTEHLGITYSLLKTMYVKANTKKNSSKTMYASQKSDKQMASPSTLSQSSFLYLYDYCANENGNSIAILVQLMLLTGRSAELILSLLKLKGTENEQQLRLYTNWQFASNNKSNNDNSAKSYILLPIKFSPCLELKNENVDYKDIDEQIRTFLPNNSVFPGEHFTIARIKSVIIHYRDSVDLSEYDVGFISNSQFSQDAHLHYGNMNKDKIQDGFKRFYYLLETQSLRSDFEYFDRRPRTQNEIIGCTWELDPTIIVQFFNYLLTNIASSKKSKNNSMLYTYNAYTTFVVKYLTLSTLHRPSQKPFRKLNSINFPLAEVTIQDKGHDSLRTVPLSRSAIKILTKYLVYRKRLCAILEPVYPELSNELIKGLTSEAELFEMIDIRSKKTKKYIPSEISKISEAGAKLTNNYERHYFTSVLSDQGMSRDDLRSLLGHKFDAYAPAEPSSINFNILSELVDLMEEHINTPVELGGLGIRIPEFDYEN